MKKKISEKNSAAEKAEEKKISEETEKNSTEAEKKPGKKFPRWAKILLTVLGTILLVLAILAGIAAWYVNSRLDLIQYDPETAPTEIPVTETEPEKPSEETAAPVTETEPEPTQTEPKYFDKDVINLLLLGTDERDMDFSDDARADCIMILSLNLREHTIKLVSIERGVGVPIPGHYTDLITHSFRYGGAQLTLDSVRNCFGVDVDRYIRVNFQTFKKAINAIGGVDIELSEREADGMNEALIDSKKPEYLVHEGLNHMDGYNALRYSRMRYIDSNWQRIERQRNTVQAILNKVKKLKPRELDTLISTVLPLIRTNLTKDEIIGLIWELPGFLTGDTTIGQMTVPIADTFWGETGENGVGYLGVDFEANQQALHDFFYGEETEETGTTETTETD